MPIGSTVSAMRTSSSSGTPIAVIRISSPGRSIQVTNVVVIAAPSTSSVVVEPPTASRPPTVTRSVRPAASSGACRRTSSPGIDETKIVRTSAESSAVSPPDW